MVADPSRLSRPAAALAGTRVTAAAGPEAVVEAAERDADWTMAAITGAAGLAADPGGHPPRQGRVALANKEALVCAGEVMLRAVAEAGATLLPVDCEHNAIFQSMADGNHGAVERIILTASGGPFRTATLEEMARATPETALRHPVWSMGAKISIDSATMMNKGLELIEAARLFGLAETKIDVLVHPQSVIHGMVCYHDGSVLAQLGSPGHAHSDRPYAGLAGADGHAVAAARSGGGRAGWSSSRPTLSPVSGAAAGAGGAACRRRGARHSQRRE